MTAGPREIVPPRALVAAIPADLQVPRALVAAIPADLQVPEPPELTCVPGTAAGPEPAARPRRGRKILRIAVTVALIGATFGFALPHLASYRSVWATIQAMTWEQALLLAAAAAASLVTGWIAICAVLPAVRLREAAVVNLGSSAVANTLPAGGALAMGVSWAMLSSWGVSAADYALYTLVSGIWNVFARLSFPAAAVLILATDSRPSAGLVASAGAGLVLLVAAAAGFDYHNHRRVEQALATVGLDPALGLRRIDQLSGGQMRRVVLAGLLARSPRAIILDEPMAGSGREETDRLVALLTRLKGRFAMILVEHDMTAVFALAAAVVAATKLRSPGAAKIVELPDRADVDDAEALAA